MEIKKPRIDLPSPDASVLTPGGVAVYPRRERRSGTGNEGPSQFGPETFSGKDWEASTKSDKGDSRMQVHFNPNGTFTGKQFVGHLTVTVDGNSWQVVRDGQEDLATLRLSGKIMAFQDFIYNIGLIRYEGNDQAKIVGRNPDFPEETVTLSLIREKSK